MICKSDKRNIVAVDTVRVNGGPPEHAVDFLSVEEPLEIHVEVECGGASLSRTISVTMRTPGHDSDLALGFLFSEGIIFERNDVKGVNTKDCNFVNVVLAGGIKIDTSLVERHSFVNSSCGVCGKKSVSSIVGNRRFHLNSNAAVTRDIISGLPGALRMRQPDFETTGGIHASALFDFDGTLLALREDVGRHNALDKLIGSQFLGGKLPLSENILLLSGRASFELIQKAAGAGIPIVAAVGAPSSLAVELAGDSGMTLLGFVRETRFNIYTGAERILM
ncbi:MAG: formate dehydrogenase accessory sulfurtransferase FdhD [Candidatus Obscuribacterales bacterium]|nr:formate dehydrogenase accessory sulfurtransferase FdhD [Candidatus Obscuribacterales bacterium]